MGQALYRKYRSKSLNEVVGQEHITKTLARAVKNNRISHAYLFTGPRGVGKTSIARILAHDINGLSYSDESQHVDIIEIDAATHGLTEDVRELREKVYVAPTSAKYKVYIIDEVHMMSPAAFNALLKTLEEPPEHAVFILATTNAHKVPDTIVSRTQRFQFHPIESDKVVKHLKYIAEQEKIAVDDAALSLIAHHGQGSFRDSISLLDQAANFSPKVSQDTINSLLGLPPEKMLGEIVSELKKGNASDVAISLGHLFNQGYAAPIIASELSSLIRERFIANEPLLGAQTLDLLAQLIEVPSSANPDQFLEITLLKFLPITPQIKSIETAPEAHPTIEPEKKATPAETAKPVVSTKVPKESTPPKEASKAPATNHKLDNEQWSKVLDLLRASYNTLYGLVRMAEVDFSEPGVLRLRFAFAFHQKRLADPKNRELILGAVKQVTGQSLSLESTVDPELLKSKKQPDEVPDSQDTPDLDTISSIFGGGELIAD